MKCNSTKTIFLSTSEEMLLNYLCTQQCFLICQSIWPADVSYFIHVLPWYLIIMPYNTIKLHEPQAETDSLKLFWFHQIYVLSILITSTTKRGSEHTNSQYFLAGMSLFMAIFAKQWVFKTSVFVHMTLKGIETLPDFSFKLRIDQGRKLKHIKAENICSEKLAPYSPAFDLSLSAVLTNFNFRSDNSCMNR